LVSNLGEEGRVATKTGAGENHRAEKGGKGQNLAGKSSF